MEPLKFTGKIHQIGKTQTWPSGFAKRLLVLVTNLDRKFPDYAAFEFDRFKSSKDDPTTMLDGYAVGDTVTVKFYLSANESKSRPGEWYGSCRAVSIARDGQADDTPNPADASDGHSCPIEDAPDDLPF